MSYEDFVQVVRAYRPSELLPAIAVAAIRAGSHDSATKEEWGAVSPWALAAAAKASICFGNEHRHGVVDDGAIRRICAAYHAIYEPAVARDARLGTVEATVVRIAYEQFIYQGAIFGELTRSWALFVEGPAMETPPGPERDWPSILGADVRTFIGVGFLAWVSAINNAGYFDPTWLDRPGLEVITGELDIGTMQRVTDLALVTGFEEFRRSATQPPPHPLLPQHSFNPLEATPFVRMPDGRLLAPQPGLILRRVAPSGLYYPGLRAWGSDFTEELGTLFEAYVGRQLRDIPGVSLVPEIAYKTKDGTKRSVDWFIILPEMVVLVEAKSTRLPIGGRSGATSMMAEIDRTLGKAVGQINDTETCLVSLVPEFEVIPTDRPRLGIVATLEPYYVANSPFIRQNLPATDIPVVFADAREIEALVAVAQSGTIGEVLTRLLTDEVRRHDGLSALLSVEYGEAQLRNPLLDSAWQQLPWSGWNDASDD